MDIRKTFLEYFKKNDHLVMPSSSLIPSDDQSVLLTTAGMQQFKPYYLGIKKPPSKKITTIQKCFRTSDIEKVGYTDQHLTFFEMLGNFAFADYFKKEAINFAMDFILNILKLPLNKLSAGVFSGDDKIPADSESAGYWNLLGIPETRIYKYGKSENFWGPAGDSGPCGPCSEIYYDFGPEFGCKKKDCSPGCGCGRFLEIWNLVFTQYNFNGRDYKELPDKNIDTGMGLERIAAVIEGYPSVFKTPLFEDIVLKIEELSGRKLTSIKDKMYNENINRCIKIVADHSRAVVFLITDGVVPSNESRGYILRRIIRRAVRFGKMLDIKDYFLNDIAEITIKNYLQNYPELKNMKDIIFRIINDEEKRFSNTLREGTRVLAQKIEELTSSGLKYLAPEYSFRLYDTFGFPVELTAEILKESGLDLDVSKFNEYLKSHSEKSKVKTAFNKKVDLNLDLYKKIATEIEVYFSGYEKLKTDTIVKYILKIYGDGRAAITDKLTEGEYGEIICENTPFYGEKGGQVGDRGIIRTNNAIFTVEDTQLPVEGLIIHRGKVKEGTIKTSDKVSAEVDLLNRKNISKNHTSTHLLHWALRTVFGTDVFQSGSSVSGERLRFDYSTGKVPSRQEIEKIERLINDKIQKDDIVRCFETTKEYADETGAISLFDEKYGKFVRVVEINDYSRELCGGIHVNRTGEIGLLKIISESGIGSNIRRIEAVAGLFAFDYLSSSNKILEQLSTILDTDEDRLVNRVESLKMSEKKMKDDITDLKVKAIKREIILKNEELLQEGKLNLIEFDFTKSDFSLDIDTKTMGLIGDELINQFKNKNTFIIFSNIINNKSIIILHSSKDLVDKGINCGLIAKEIGKILKGGGGGKAEFANIGGSDINALGKAAEFVRNKVLEILT
ncbi:MAG: alanine--tRNA ligase [Actinobacteria bacterium]|nr:alanine--tRNA ligase [Actinomycetota bacterium]